MKYVPSLTTFSSVVLALLVVVAFCPWAVATDVPYTGPNDGDWNVPANWQTGFVPDQGFDEAGVVNNGATVVVSTPPSASPGGVRLGSAAGTTGGLRIVSGGNLTAVDPPVGGETGAITIGSGGTGNLTMLGNGQLSGTSLSLGGGTGSSITMSDTSSISISGAVNLQRTTTLNGPGISFTGTGNLTLGGTSILVPGITAAGSPKIVSQGIATVNGTLKPMFTGVTPAAGNKWTIIDVPATINGGFTTVDTSMAPALSSGLAYQVNQATSGARRLLQLEVAEILTLQVNRVTGAVSILNSGAQAKTIDGYTIFSQHGALTGAWNSLADQAVTGWVEAAPVATDLSELNPQNSSTLNSGGSFNLGTPYVRQFPAFGVDPDDISFEYSQTDGRTIQGSVVYSGTKVFNNFVLNVDPATGAVAFRNDSPFNISIDGYAIYSASGSLVPGSWNSLDDQNVAGWEQAPPAPSAAAVAELKADGTTNFQPQTGFSLGNLFKTVGATQDLRFEFLMEGEDLPSIGTVLYGAFTPPTNPSAGIPGDFNEDGKVDAADYVVWRKTDGMQAGYNLWRTNFGRTSGSGAALGAAAGVPEPASAVLLILAAVADLQLRGGRR
ncbi:MAG TPA: hypothetical protein VJ828_05440 [Lacipirellulaceae bacterium]|nr:hypothetical protein [Lacipirellulaceae bacterium]